ncbi:phage tail tape measure protein [Clostridium pasteurianum]|uniref:Phage-related minor tail protein n=1 Tax=Clostridium pasteurianum BC1 TaxID=86416 RepID=R4K0W7_CLOPA|nr:phage tail tape measure protein [Clostridium pasteurianum]AGK95411.1 phage-related minor tail protein [Clostridium pasteurianum BC1]
MANNIKGITVEIGGDTTPLEKALEGVNKTSRDLQSELKQVNTQLKFDPSNTVLLDQKQKLLAESITNTKTKLETLQKAEEQAEKQLKNGDIGEEQFRALQREVIKTTSQLNGLETQLKNTKKAAEDDEGIWDKLSSGIKKSVLDIGDSIKNGIGLSIGHDIWDKFKEGSVSVLTFGSDAQKAMNQLQASTGMSTISLNDMKKTMTDIYNDNFGEDFADIGNALGVIKQNWHGNSDEIKGLTENAILLRDTFGYEVNESFRSANALVQNFGISAKDAYNLIAQGAQSGLDKNGDLLDTINEYPVEFKSLGLNAQDMFNILQNGAKAGSFSIDKMADAIKEFSIRAKDGSSTTEDALSKLGFNVQQTEEKFSKGGDTAKQAFQQVNEKLLALKDPLLQNQLGVELWGTQWEDLQKTGIAALTNLNGSINTSKDALGEMNKVKYNDLGSAFEGIKRNLETGILLPISEKVLPELSDFSNWFTSNMPEIKAEVGNAMDKVLPIIEDLGKGLEFCTENASTLIPAVIGLTGALGTLSVLKNVVSTIGTIKEVAGGLGLISAAAEGAGVASGGLAAGLGGLAIAAAPWLLAGAGVVALGVGIHHVMTEQATPAVDLFADSVNTTTKTIKDSNGQLQQSFDTTTTKISNSTKQGVGAYIKMSDDVQGTLTKLYVNNTTITDKTVSDMKTKYDSMGSQIKAGMDKHFNEEYSSMQQFLQKSNALSDSEKATALAKLQTDNNNKKAKIDQYEQQIQQILQNAANQHRSLTLQEQQQINSIQDTMKTKAVNSLSDNEVQAKVILQRIKDYGTNITAQQASSIIQNANKQRDGAVSAANSQYDKTVAEIIRMRDESHSITADQAEKLIADAKKQKEESIKHAEELRSEAVKKVTSMNSDIGKSVDTTTGNMLTNWQKFANWWGSWWPSSKTLTVNSKASDGKDFSSNASPPQYSGGWIGQNASGTGNWTGGFTTIHELGYEIYDLPKGTRIYNHDASEDLVKNTAAEVAKSILDRYSSDNVSSTGDIYLTSNNYLDSKLIISKTDKIQASKYTKASRNKGLK